MRRAPDPSNAIYEVYADFIEYNSTRPVIIVMVVDGVRYFFGCNYQYYAMSIACEYLLDMSSAYEPVFTTQDQDEAINKLVELSSDPDCYPYIYQ